MKNLKTTKDLLKNDVNVQNNIKHLLIGIGLIISVFIFSNNHFISGLIFIIWFVWIYITMLLFIKWLYYWPATIFRIYKYWKLVEKYNQDTNWRVWWDMTLGSFILKEFVNPEIIYDCLDGKGLNLNKL